MIVVTVIKVNGLKHSVITYEDDIIFKIRGA